MSKSTEYNGHRNWHYWNVSLWLGNDAGLYRLTQYVIARYRNKRTAARVILGELNDCGLTCTPDGARYNIARIYAAIQD